MAEVGDDPMQGDGPATGAEGGTERPPEALTERQGDSGIGRDSPMTTEPLHENIGEHII